MSSPYQGVSPDGWTEVTEGLIENHPLEPDEIVEIVLTTWQSIFASSLGKGGFHIGAEIFPKPQIMGFFLHELIPLELSHRYPKVWRGEESASDKDIVYVPDDNFSIEVKTSSHAKQIFGNRSYAQKTTRGKKAKDGYYLTVNFEKVERGKPEPSIRLVRFGWLDSSDWIGQKANTGQQSRLPPDVDKYKLKQLYVAT